jgi:hypothetical protein
VFTKAEISNKIKILIKRITIKEESMGDSLQFLIFSLIIGLLLILGGIEIRRSQSFWMLTSYTEKLIDLDKYDKQGFTRLYGNHIIALGVLYALLGGISHITEFLYTDNKLVFVALLIIISAILLVNAGIRKKKYIKKSNLGKVTRLKGNSRQ